MITATNEKTYEFRGLSTDEKPVESVGNGSIFISNDFNVRGNVSSATTSRI